MRIGLITDTHLPALIRQLDELGPECAAFLSSVDLILHGGDVTAASVLDWAAQFAPVIAVQGNNDDFRDPRLRQVQYLELEGWRIGMAHDLTPETQPLPAIHYRRFDRPLDIMIGGHTHLERLRHEHGMLLVNSGSPILPHHKETRLGTAALLELTQDRVCAEIVRLGETAGRPNPGRGQALELLRGQFHRT
ncbi:MAG TPA: metallophosphoesterase family protein [Dehalococcoidia bacterium]|jgi:hypothetical protein